MPNLTRQALSQSWAERVQADTTPDDYALTDQARLIHPTVRWWWGVRRTTTGAYAQCYLCGAIVTTWASRWPMPDRARSTLLDHRDRHVIRSSVNQVIHTPGRSGGGDTPEGNAP